MRLHPFLIHELFVDWQGRERVVRVESELVSNQAAEPEDSGFLHSVKLGPKIGVGGKSDHLQLRPIELRAQRQDAQANLSGAELTRGQSIKAQLNGVAAHEFLAQVGRSRLRCSSRRR